MVVYVNLDVSIHGFSLKTVEEVRQRVLSVIKNEFPHSYDSDIEVEVIEHAGTEE